MDEKVFVFGCADTEFADPVFWVVVEHDLGDDDLVAIAVYQSHSRSDFWGEYIDRPPESFEIWGPFLTRQDVVNILEYTGFSNLDATEILDNFNRLSHDLPMN